MHTSESTANISKALAAAQGAFPLIARDKTVRVATRSGSAYTFSYAPLETIMSAVRPALAANGLAISQGAEVLDSGLEVLFTRLSHESGEWIENRTMIHVEKSEGKEGKTAQAYASGLTYARRYGVTMLLCLATEDDDDGNAASGNAVEHVVHSKAPLKRISPEDVASMSERLAAIGKEASAFAKFMGVATLADLPASKLEAAKTAITAAEKKAMVAA